MDDRPTQTAPTEKLEPEPERNQPAAPPAGAFRFEWADVVVAACVYEVAAEATNAFFEEPLLPSLSSLVRRVSPKAVLRRTPPWVHTAGVLGLGFTLYLAASARRSLRAM